MYVVYDSTKPNLMYGPFNFWDDAVTFADHTFMAGVNTEIRLLLDPTAMIAYKSTANK